MNREVRRWLFASDLDGTLFQPDHQLSARTVEILRDVVQLAGGAHGDANGDLIAVTGRSPYSAVRRLRPARLFHTVICNNGAVVVDVASGATISAEPIDPDRARELIGWARTNIADVGFAWEYETGFGWDAEFDAVVNAHPYMTAHHIAGVYDPANGPITKLMVLVPDGTPDALRTHLCDHTDLEVTTSGINFVEVTAPGVHKGAALERYAARTGTQRSEVVAYGDNNNDVTMLAWAGLGVAVANATPEAKLAADITIGPNTADSVALDMLARAQR